MKNNLHEDKSFNDLVKSYHTKLVEGLSLPKWMTDIECPFCKEKLTPYSIRGINFKTNPRNFGDLCIDFMCEKCKCGDNLYFRNAYSDLSQVSKIIDGTASIDPKQAILEESMYKMCYNNTVEKMIGDKNGNT